MAPRSSTLAWKIPWMEELGGLQSMGSLKVGHNWATSLSLFTFMHWRRQWQPTPVFLPGEPQGAWWAAISGVAQSRTRLKWLSSSSNLCFKTGTTGHSSTFLPLISESFLPVGTSRSSAINQGTRSTLAVLAGPDSHPPLLPFPNWVCHLWAKWQIHSSPSSSNLT